MVNNTQYLTGGKSPNPLAPPSNFLASPGNAKVTLTWTDPPNATVEPSGQTYATWAYTQVVRKEGSQPTGPNDGTVVVQSSVRDQYATKGFVDTGLTNDTLYYYGAFAYNSDGVYSEGAFVSAAPVAGTPLGDLTEGTLITINENGSPVEFYVAKQNYEPDLNGYGKTLVLRKKAYDYRPFQSTLRPYSFPNTEIYSFLNSSYYSLFSTFVKSLITPTTFEYCYNGSNILQATGKVFLPTAPEMGVQDLSSQQNSVGKKFPTADAMVLCEYNGENISYWTRISDLYGSPVNGYGGAIIIQPSKTAYMTRVDNSNYSRPCFSLLSTALVDANLALIETA